MRKCKTAWLFFFTCIHAGVAVGQETFPVNAVADKRTGVYAFTNASIFKDAQNS